ncbi:MAG: phage holin family protein [Longimicrobiales bacterium]|nr:phage holin family protein [Longimicrobiales bacterium]
MRNLVIRLFINAVALWGASEIVGGIRLTDDFTGVLIVAAIFGLVNALIKPLVTLLALPLVLLTLGLITVVINALMLMLTAAISDSLSVEGFWTALLGALVISVVSFLLSAFLGERMKSEHPG